MLEKLLDMICKDHPLTEREDAARKFEAAGMAFEARGYDAKGLGHIGVMTAQGPMRLETLIVNPFEVDAPIFSYDRIHGMGQEIMMMEMYDSLLGDSFHNDGLLRAFGSQEDPSGKQQEYWYTPLIVSPRLTLKGTQQDESRFDGMARDFVEAYLAAAQEAAACDAASKRCKAAVYSEGLLKNGGPATDPVKAAMGEEWTAALFRQTLFGA